MTPRDLSEPTLFSILDSLPEGIAIFSPERKLLYISPAMATVTGGGAGSVGGALANLARRHSLWTLDGTPLTPDQFPITRAFEGKESHDELYIYIDADNRPRRLSISCVRVSDASGRLLCVFAAIADVTATDVRDRRLNFLVQSFTVLSLTQNMNERLVEKAKLMVPSLADWAAVDIVNSSGTIERVAVIHEDPEMLRYIVEYQKKYPQLQESSTQRIIRTGQSEFIPRVTDEMLRSAVTSEEQYRATLKLRLKSVMIMPIIMQGAARGALTLAFAESGRVFTDEDFKFFQDFCVHLGIVLENARLYAEVERRDKAKDLFLASLSHELRNPLAPIKSSLELLKMKGTAPDIREELDIIEHQFDHMARLLNDLLDVSRFTQDKFEITMQSVGLRRLIEKALRATDALLKESGIRLSVHLPDTSIPVMADETRLEQALINVLTNAIKYTPSGGSIQVTLQHDATTAYITVRDDGIGIPAEDLANIFKMYYQGKRRAIDASGLGIGLLLVRKIVELHGGTVAARSEGSGQGSEFEITVPLSKEAAPSPDSVPTNHSITGKRILVVDDNAPAADALVRLLNKLGADAEARYSGAEALCAPRLDEFDVMLLDLGMPQMDGFEVARQMRQKGLTAPVVALTGYGMLEDKERTRDAGFSAHLTKPVGLRELTALFETV